MTTITSTANARLQSDEQADILIQDLYNELEGKAVGQLYKNYINTLDEVNYAEMPTVLQQYFEQNQQLPPWANLQQIQQAEQLFLHMGPEIALSLLCRALPIGYTSVNVVKVLTSTGYLAQDKKMGSAKRLMETTQFIIDVLSEGALRDGKRGVKSVLKVRFLHAMVRYHLQKHHWDKDLYGVPINQEDMVSTILTFSVSSIIGLERLNIALSESDKAAWVHFWRVVGHIIGVEDDLNPSNYADAVVLYESVLANQAGESEDGQLLTATLANFLKDIFNFKFLPLFPQYLIRYLIHQTHYADLLKLAKPSSTYEKLVFNNLIRYLRGMNGLKGNRIADRFAQPLNRWMARRLIAYFEQEFNLKLHIPQAIRTAWGLA